MIGKEKIASILLASLLVLSFSMTFAPSALADEYPPLPLLAVKVPVVGTIDVWLMGEGETDLDPFWDMSGFDIQMHYNPDAFQVTNVIVDPDYWYESFWPSGVMVLLLDYSTTPGYVRVAFLGIPAPGGSHTPPYGQGRLFTMETTVVNMDLADISLMNPDPRPNIAPWGTAGFPVDVSGYPHPERGMAPWFGFKKSPPLPHLVTVQGPPVAAFTESTHTPARNEVIYLDASGSSAEVPIVSYEWDFNSDGVFDATGVTTSTSYATYGFHVITLKVTDNAGMTDTASAMKAVDALQNAYAEHRIFIPFFDEDGLDTLTARVRNYGEVAVEVKAKFTTIDKKTGAELGTMESDVATATLGTRTYLPVDWDPSDYGWKPWTSWFKRYDVRVELSFFDVFTETWVTCDTYTLGLIVLL